MQSDKKKYSICKTTVAEDEMVGCDICDNWFQPACLNLSKLSTSKYGTPRSAKRQNKNKNWIRNMSKVF